MLSRALEHDATVLHDIAMIGDFKRQGGVLLDQYHGELLLVLQAVNDFEDLLDDHRRQPKGRFVE